MKETIKKRESALKSSLKLKVRRWLPGFVLLSHEDVRTVGIPDWSLTGRGRTSWWEFKHATPDFDLHGRQKLTMQRLEGAGRAFYVVWYEDTTPGSQRTYIMAPHHMSKPLDRSAYIEFAAGFDHRFVVEFMRGVHGDHK